MMTCSSVPAQGLKLVKIGYLPFMHLVAGHLLVKRAMFSLLSLTPEGKKGLSLSVHPFVTKETEAGQ